MKDRKITSEAIEKIHPLKDLETSSDPDDEENGFRQSLRSSLSRSGGQRELNMRGSLRDSLRRSNGQRNLRASMQRSDSQGNLRDSLRDLQRGGGEGNLRGSMRDSLRRSNGQINLRASMQRSDSQGNLRDSLRDSQRSGGEGNLRASMSMRDFSTQKSDSSDLDDDGTGLRQNLRSSLNRSGSQRELNTKGSLRDSLRRSNGQSNLRASMQRSDSQGNLRGSLRDSQRSGGQSNRRVTVSRSDGQDAPRASLERRNSRRNLRGSGNRGLSGSGNEDDLRGSSNNVRGSKNRALRGSDRNELAVSFSEDLVNNVSEQKVKKNTDLSKSMNALVNWDVAQEADERGDLRRSDSNIMTSAPQSNASNDIIGTTRRPPKKDSRENLVGLKGSITPSNESRLRNSVNGQRNDALESPRRGVNTPTGRRGNTLRRSASKRSNEDLNNTRPSAVTRTSGNDLRSSGGRGRRSSLSQSMTALRSDDDNANKRPNSGLRSSVTDQSGRNSLRSSTRGHRPALSQSMTRGTSVDNDRSGNRLRNSTGSPNNLRSSTRVNGPRSRTERPDSRLRSSSTEQRNYNSLRSSARGDGMSLSKSMIISDVSDVKADRRSGTRDGKQKSDSNFGNLVRKASERRHNRPASEDGGVNDIEALKRNLIL